MPKLYASTNGRTNDLGTWEIDQEQTDKPHLIISKGPEVKTITFASDYEAKLFSDGIGMCRAKDQNFKPIYISRCL